LLSSAAATLRAYSLPGPGENWHRSLRNALRKLRWASARGFSIDSSSDSIQRNTRIKVKDKSVEE